MPALAELDRAVEAARTLRYRGTPDGRLLRSGWAQVTTVEVARSADGRLRAERRGAWELGRDEDGRYLRTTRTGGLLRLGGVTVRAFDRDRFLRNYRVEDGGTSQLDTGPARVLLATRRDGDVRSETLHVDRDTGLIVRRETRDLDGRPVRVVAYTELEVDPATGLLDPPDASGEVGAGLAHARSSARRWLDRGSPPAASCPAASSCSAPPRWTAPRSPPCTWSTGTACTRCRCTSSRAVSPITPPQDATPLDLPGGGSVWRWPGSEPRRVVWTGDGRTFTALTDAPTGPS